MPANRPSTTDILEADHSRCPPLVSVVTGVYNGAASLRWSLQSVLAQEGVPLELIVVDDGSRDATPEILAGLAARDARVRVVRQDNQGLTRALRHGCSLARGEYIARHDADDFSLPGRLAAQVDFLAHHPECVLASCWAYEIGPRGELLVEHRRPDDPTEATRLLRERLLLPCGHGSVLMRRAAYERAGGYRPEFYYAQDADLWLRLTEQGLVGHVPRFLYAFTMSAGSISCSRRDLQYQCVAQAVACTRARAAGQSEDDLLREVAGVRPGSGNRRRSAGSGAYFIAACLRRRRDRRALDYYREAIRAAPWSWRAWLGLGWTAVMCPRPAAPPVPIVPLVSGER